MERKLMREYKIEFVGPVESLPDTDRPAIHEPIISHIQKLGQFQFAQYQGQIAPDIETYPWKEQVRQRAKRIVQLAKRCRDARKNEAGWRYALEPEIMARFTVEVSCRRCRGRLWRSELEVSPDSGDDEAPESRGLRTRQMRRRPCTCDPTDNMNDPIEQGIDSLFDDRAEEAFLFDDELRSKLSKRKKHLPDRVWGLRKTNRMQNILNMVNKHSFAQNQTIEESLGLSPFRVEYEPLLFPFLVLEAKSEKSADSFMNIEIQTAFAIRELLMIQDNLRQTASLFEDAGGRPLVWFLSNRGEQWRVYICYIDDGRSSPRYVITRLWDGAIDSVNCALQLVLIMDYICDWARDKYRPSVIKQLRGLAVNDRRSLTYDSDILSLANRRDLVRERNESLGRASTETNVVQTDRETVETDSITTWSTINNTLRGSGNQGHTNIKLESIEESLNLRHNTHVDSMPRFRLASRNGQSVLETQNSGVIERESETNELQLASNEQETEPTPGRFGKAMANFAGKMMRQLKRREDIENARGTGKKVTTGGNKTEELERRPSEEDETQLALNEYE